MTTPTFTAPPTAPTRNSPATFRARMDAFLSWIVTAWGELTTFVTWAASQVTTINGAASAAAASQDAAAASASAASNTYDDTVTSGPASVAAAAASAASAINAPGTSATSTTSLSIGLGDKAPVLAQTGKQFALGQTVVIARTSDPSKRMTGPITVFANPNGPSPTLTVDVQRTNGSGGPYTDWTISLAASLTEAFAPDADMQAGTATDLPANAHGVALAIAQLASQGPLLYGDGSDGDVTVSGSVTLARDMYYNNLTVAAGAALDCRGYRIFVANTLDLSNAPAGGIRANGGDGGNGGNAATNTTSLPGSAGSAGTAGTVGVGSASGAGENGGAGAASGAAGKAGTTNGSAGSAGATVSATVQHRVQVRLQQSEATTTLLKGGAPGADGAGNDSYDVNGDGSVIYRNGGAGGRGAGGGIVQIFARYVRRGASTAVGAVQAKGGKGGKGGNGQAGLTGGGSGAGGAGGGWIYLVCQALLGAAVNNLFDVTGGDGGDGGTGVDATSKGGYGGGSGQGGRLTLAVMSLASLIDTLSSAAAKAAVAPTNGVGGTGATANLAQFNL